MVSIQLLGMKHSGKSTLGALAARRLGWSFSDLDTLLEAEAPGNHHRTAREIYREEGAQGFQTYEARAANNVVPRLQAGKTVLAWGGGTVTNTAAVEALRTHGVLVLLEERTDVLYERILRGGLPAFLSKDKPWEDFQRLFTERMALMGALAHHRLAVNGASIDSTLNNLLDTLKGDLDARK
jgi:shikimate kinase